MRSNGRAIAIILAMLAAVLTALFAGSALIPGDDPAAPSHPSAGGSSIEASRPGTEGQVLLAEVYYYSAHPQEADEYVRIYNGTWSELDLTGWKLQGGGWQAVFPAGLRIPAGETLYVARDAAAFSRLMGFAPAAEWEMDGDPAVPQMELAAGEMAQLANRGGEVILIDPAGVPVDVVAYGQSDYQGPGWKGWRAWGAWKGEVLARARDEATLGPRSGGLYVGDTDRAEDWHQGDEWMNLRTLRPGQSFFPYVTLTAAGPLVAYASPDSSFAVLDNLFARAGRSIDINMYDLHHPLLVERLAEAARRGVKVRALLEGSWRDGIREDQKWGAEVLVQAGAEVRWLIKNEDAGIRGRYWLDHAKYGVIDGQKVFVQSENFARHGVPADPTSGNRGWGVMVQDSSLARYLTDVFEFDWNPRVAESQPFTPGHPAYGGPAPGFQPPAPTLDPGNYPHPFPAITVQGARVTPVLAPDHTLLETRGIIGMIRSAKHSLLIQQQYIHYHWGDGSGSLERTPNLFMREVINAARRGVKVRVMVGDHFLDPSYPKDSTHTVSHLNQLARAEGLDMEARIIKSEVTGLAKLHNKGVIVDDQAVLVSSINWSGASPRFNREVGLIVEHPAVGRYYSDMFYYDWYDGSPPDGAIISALVPGRYVQLFNPTARPLDLSGWRLAAGQEVWTLPAGAVVPAGQALTVTGDGRAFALEYGRQAELSGLRLLMEPAAGVLELQTPAGLPVDAVAWGQARPGWSLTPGNGQALCRPDVHRDTNTQLDWQAAAPAPGAAGCGGAVSR